MPRTPILERAFELAQSGEYLTVTGVSHALKREKYSAIQPTLAGAAIRKQLRDLLRAANRVAA